MAIEITGQKLLEKYEQGGFTSLVGDEPIHLSDYLRIRSKENGMEAFAILADVLHRVHFFFLDHDERGGVAVDFVKTLDGLAFKYLPAVRKGDPDRSMSAASELQSLVLAEIDRYDPMNFSA